MPLHWTQGHPSDIANRLRAIAHQLPPLAFDVATDEASRAESEMKERAEWTDRTTQARGGLFGKAEQTAAGARITLGGTAEHNIYLEVGTRYMAARPIIRPVLDKTEISAVEQLSSAVMEMFR
jgi:hypothetical protein